MQFKEIKPFIFSSCVILKGDNIPTNVSTYGKCIFDDDEVIGIRSRYKNYHGICHDSYIEVLL